MDRSNRHDHYPAALTKAMIGAAPPFMEYIAKYVLPSGVKIVYSMDPMPVVTFVL